MSQLDCIRIRCRSEMASSTLATALTFADVLRAVESAPDLTAGVRGNMRSAVERTARLMGAAGLGADVDIQLIAKRLDRLTAAKLGLQSPMSFSAYKSNLHRALRLAGVTVMPSASRTSLLPAWADLSIRVQAVDKNLWIPLSRFAHYASEQGWQPDEIDDKYFERFALALRETCLSSKADKTIRNTAGAWASAQQRVVGWPQSDLGYRCKPQPATLLPWSHFPPTLEADARRFVDRDQGDWLTTDTRRPLKPRTQANYLAGIQRAASILVRSGIETVKLETLADLVTTGRAQVVLRSIHDRTGRKSGGHVGFLAVLLLLIGRDHVGLVGQPLQVLEQLQRKTLPERRQMSDRTLARFNQFDDSSLLDRLLRLPEHLLALADRSEAVSQRSAKLARCGLYLALLIDLGCRSANVAELELQRHIILEGSGRHLRGFIVVPGDQTKNGTEIRASLRPLTIRMLKHYIDRYRHIHCAQQTRWLFPRQDGSHWTVVQACADIKDLAAKHVGADVTPHLMRALAGKIVLDQNPGALAIVQQLLGHKNIQTTAAFYTRLEPAKARAHYHEILTKAQSRYRS